MTESTARAERIKPQSSTPPSYIWEVAQKPVSVRLPYGMIDRMEKEVVDNFRSLTSRGSEIGGLLLGTAEPGNPAVVTIDDFELVACDYSRGPLYRLSDADMGRFERAVQQRQSGNGLVVVGYFRSHTRKGLSLDAEDVAFLEARFREPHHVALLVRPYATKASTAGIFIREGGALRGESSYLEFPFRSSQLTSFRPSTLLAEAAPPPPASAPPASAAAPMPAAPKSAARAQIVPIASRREINLPVPPPPAEPPAKEPAAAAPAEPAKPAVKTEATAPADPAMPAAVEEKPAAKVEPKKVEPQKAEPKKAGSAAQPVKEEKGKTGMVVGIVAAIAVILMGLFVYPGFMKHAAIPIPGQNGSALALRVERTGTDILLTWNRDSDSIRNASHAVLYIFDGERHENYDMDLGQLRTGSIVYLPITADVSFRMDVTRKGKSTPISESVRVLRTRPSPMGDDAQAQTASAKPAATTAAKNGQPPAATPDASADTAAADETKPGTSATPTKPFDASSLVQRLRPASPGEVLDAPPINPGAAAPGASGATISGLNLNGVAPAPAAPAPPPASAPEKKPPAVSGGQIKQAELISRKEPEYPKLARQMGVKGVVELTATIGIDGRVKGVKVEHGHPLLTKAATDAVLQWVYKPTLLNGQPVQNDTRITLNFMGER
jgi:protein TonB